MFHFLLTQFINSASDQVKGGERNDKHMKLGNYVGSVGKCKGARQ